MNRNIYSLIIFTLLSIASLRAQSGTVAAGGDATGIGGSVAYTVGQIDYAVYTGEDGSINLGIQQPHVVVIIDTDDPEINLLASVFPVPANAHVVLQIKDIDLISATSNLRYELVSLQGQLLQKEDITSSITTIQIEQYPVATYLVNVINDKNVIRTFKIIKSK